MKTVHIAITGPRPKSMGTYDMGCIQYFNVKQLIYNTFYDICTEFATCEIVFHVGGAPGIDRWAFDSAYSLKECFNIKISLDIPFKYQYQKWPRSDREMYFEQCDKADYKVFVDTVNGYKDESAPMGEFSAKKLFNRNHYMVDKSQIVLGFWNYESSGTRDTLDYGKNRKKDVRIFDLRPILGGTKVKC